MVQHVTLRLNQAVLRMLGVAGALLSGTARQSPPRTCLNLSRFACVQLRKNLYAV